MGRSLARVRGLLLVLLRGLLVVMVSLNSVHMRSLQFIARLPVLIAEVMAAHLGGDVGSASDFIAGGLDADVRDQHADDALPEFQPGARPKRQRLGRQTGASSHVGFAAGRDAATVPEDLGPLLPADAELCDALADDEAMKGHVEAWERSTGSDPSTCHRICDYRPGRPPKNDICRGYSGCGLHGQDCKYRYQFSLKAGTRGNATGRGRHTIPLAVTNASAKNPITKLQKDEVKRLAAPTAGCETKRNKTTSHMQHEFVRSPLGVPPGRATQRIIASQKPAPRQDRLSVEALLAWCDERFCALGEAFELPSGDDLFKLKVLWREVRGDYVAVVFTFFCYVKLILDAWAGYVAKMQADDEEPTYQGFVAMVDFLCRDIYNSLLQSNLACAGIVVMIALRYREGAGATPV